MEWQFYLIAPLWYYFVTAKAFWKQITMVLAILAFMLGSGRLLPAVDQNAALPFYVAYFYCGAMFYFLYKRVAGRGNLESIWFPSALIICMALFREGEKALGLLPILSWALFFILMIESPNSVWARTIGPVFSNKMSVWIGKISFSIYLCHPLTINLSKWFLLQTCPNLTQMQHLFVLAVVSIMGTLLFSAMLYHMVELPGIRWGASISSQLAPKRRLTGV